MINFILTFTLLYVACAVATVGFVFAQFQRQFKFIRQERFESNKVFAMQMGLLGPIGFVVTVLCSGFVYGWLWPWSAKAKREADCELA